MDKCRGGIANTCSKQDRLQWFLVTPHQSTHIMWNKTLCQMLILPVVLQTVLLYQLVQELWQAILFAWTTVWKQYIVEGNPYPDFKWLISWTVTRAQWKTVWSQGLVKYLWKKVYFIMLLSILITYIVCWLQCITLNLAICFSDCFEADFIRDLTRGNGCHVG